MIQEQLAFFCRNFFPTTAPFPLPKSAPHGWLYPAGKAALFESRRSRAANTPCAPAALPLAGFHPHRAACRMGGGLFFPPGAAVRTGMRRVRRAQRALSGCHCGYRMGALRGKRMAAARPQQLCAGHPAAAPAGHFAAYCRAFCRRDRGAAGADPLPAARRTGYHRAGHCSADGAGAERPHPDALFYRPLLVDGKRCGSHVQLDELVFPERAAHGFSAAHLAGTQLRSGKTGRV